MMNPSMSHAEQPLTLLARFAEQLRRDPQALAAAMKRLIREEMPLKQALADWQNTPHARQFTRPNIAARFAAGLRQAAAPPDTRLPIAPE